MSGPARTLRIAAAALVVTGGLIVASCGGSSVATAPVAQATNAPASTQSVPPAGGSLTLPAAATGQVATLALVAGAPAGLTITASSSATAPGSAPQPSSLKRSAEAISGANPFFFITFTVSGTLSAQLVNSETVSLLSSQPANASYYVEFDDITSSPGTKLGCAGPGTVSGGIATVTNQSASGVCTNGNGNGPSLVAGHTYLVQFYYVAAGSPTSTPTGSSPTSTPTGGSPTSSPTGGTPTGATPTPLPSFTFTNSGADTMPCSPTLCNVPLEVTDGAITFQATFASPNPAATMAANIALNTSQINPSASFPVYNNAAGGTVELYFQVSATPATVFPLTPAITVSGLTGVTQCIFYGYVSSTSNAWTAISPQTGTAPVTGGNATFPAVSPGGSININPAPFYGAIVCT
jgi:hypothetical protein